MCTFYIFFRAYGINKVDKGPKEVLNAEIQKVQVPLMLMLEFILTF